MSDNPRSSPCAFYEAIRKNGRCADTSAYHYVYEILVVGIASDRMFTENRRTGVLLQYDREPWKRSAQMVGKGKLFQFQKMPSIHDAVVADDGADGYSYAEDSSTVLSFNDIPKFILDPMDKLFAGSVDDQFALIDGVESEVKDDELDANTSRFRAYGGGNDTGALLVDPEEPWFSSTGFGRIPIADFDDDAFVYERFDDDRDRAGTQPRALCDLTA